VRLVNVTPGVEHARVQVVVTGKLNFHVKIAPVIIAGLDVHNRYLVVFCFPIIVWVEHNHVFQLDSFSLKQGIEEAAQDRFITSPSKENMKRKINSGINGSGQGSRRNSRGFVQ
jgi:hypothetical protein